MDLDETIKKLRLIIDFEKNAETKQKAFLVLGFLRELKCYRKHFGFSMKEMLKRIDEKKND